MSRSVALLLLFALPLPAITTAAPLDALLQAEARSRLAAGYDFMNETFDVLDFSDDYGVDSSDYDGWHLDGSLAIGRRIAVDASWRQREVSVGNFAAELDSWQLAAHVVLLDGEGAGPGLALRASAWQNQAGTVERQYNLGLAATQTSQIRIEDPSDSQLQLDLVFSLPLAEQLLFSSLVSIGNSTVDFDSISGTGLYQGCLYDLAFTASEYIGTLAAPCFEDTVVTSFSKSYDANDVNVYRELRYDAQFVQAGLNLAWQTQNWLLHGGYLFYYTRRDKVDDAIEARGDTAYYSNHTLVGRIAYRVVGTLWLDLTGQYMHNQFISEIPLAYNSLTAKHFNKHYGLLSIGAQLAF
ncbi:MAG TPA: hypothetical protein VIN71_00100 [Pseudomonadales bacterium]